MPPTYLTLTKKLERDFFQLVNQLAESYLNLPAITTQEHFLVSFAYADIFIGKSFEIAFPRNRPKEGVSCKAIIQAIFNTFANLKIDL